MAENHAAWGVREIAIAAHQSDIRTPRGDRYPWRPLHLSSFVEYHACMLCIILGIRFVGMREPMADAVPRLFFCVALRQAEPEVDLECSSKREWD